MQKQSTEVFYIEKTVLKNFAILTGNTCVGTLFNKVEGLQALRTPILKITANSCLVHNMSLKT